MLENLKLLKENSVKFPAARHIQTGKMTSIKEVNYEERLNFVCPDCEKSFVAVLNIKTPHFKHKPNSACTGSFESNIHWLTKEIFKTIKRYVIPEVKIENLPEKQRQKFQLRFNEILELIPEKLRPKFRDVFKREFIDEREIIVGRIEIEKVFKTDLGNICVDIISYSENETIFIEPFYSNQITTEKKKKLSKLRVQTLSIDLIKFLNYNNRLNFNIQKLEDYLVSKESKEWTLTNVENFDKHLENYEKHLLELIEFNKSSIDWHNLQLNEISKLKTQINKKTQIEYKISNEIKELKNKICEIEKELDY